MIISLILLFIFVLAVPKFLFIAAERFAKLEAEAERKREELMKLLKELTDENNRTTEQINRTTEQIEKDIKNKAEQNLKKLKTLDSLDPELKKRLEKTLERFVS